MGRLAFRASLLVLAIYGAKAFLEKSPAEIAQDMKEKGFFDAEGNLDSTKLQSAFTSGNMSAGEKENMLRMIALSYLSSGTTENMEALDAKVSLQDDGSARVDFSSIASISEREAIAETYAQLGVKVQFRYQDTAIKSYIAKAQSEGREMEAKNTLEGLGISVA